MKPAPAIKRGWLRALIYIFLFLITLVIFEIIAMSVLSAISDKTMFEVISNIRDNIHLLVLVQTIVLTGVTALTFAFRKYFDARTIITLGFSSYRRNKDLVLGLALGLIVIGSGFLILLLSGNLVIISISPDFAYLGWSIILCLIISWVEELSFRGYILNNLIDSFHPFTGLLISSFLFAVFHLLNPGMGMIPFVNLFLAGILLGIVFIYTKTIWYALALHFSWNFFQGPVFGFPVSGIEMDGFLQQQPKGYEIITGGNFGFEGSILSSLLIILCIFALNYLYTKITSARSA